MKATLVIVALCARATLASNATTAAVDPNQDAGMCTGKIVNAAAHLAGAGLQIAVATTHCGSKAVEDHKGARCAFDVGVSTRSLWRATRLMTEASDSCGGKAMPCGVAIQNSVGFLGGVVKYGSNAKLYATGGELDKVRQELELMSTALGNSVKAMTDSAVACQNASVPVANATSMQDKGYCAAEIFSAATTASAASMEILDAQKTCAEGDSQDKTLCARDVSATFMDLMNVGVHLTNAARDCGSSNTACALQIEDVFLRASAAAAMGAEAKSYNKAGNDDKVRQKVTVTGIASAAMVRAMGQAARDCAPAATPNTKAAGNGACMGDAISVATYLADGSLEISIAMKECHQAKKNNKIHQCSADIFTTLQAFSSTINSLMLAADDCEQQGTFQATCGTDVATALYAISHAGQLGSDMGKHHASALKDAVKKNVKAQDYDETMGDSFELFATKMRAATKDCTRQTVVASSLYAETPVDKVVGSMLTTTCLLAVVGAAVFGTAVLAFRRIRARRVAISQAEESGEEALVGDIE